MKLLTKAVLRNLPPLGSTRDAEDPIFRVKFFTPDAGWTWYAIEGEHVEGDFVFYGYVIGTFPEWGTFSLAELHSVRGALADAKLVARLVVLESADLDRLCQGIRKDE